MNILYFALFDPKQLFRMMRYWRAQVLITDWICDEPIDRMYEDDLQRDQAWVKKMFGEN